MVFDPQAVASLSPSEKCAKESSQSSQMYSRALYLLKRNLQCHQ